MFNSVCGLPIPFDASLVALQYRKMLPFLGIVQSQTRHGSAEMNTQTQQMGMPYLHCVFKGSSYRPNNSSSIGGVWDILG